MGRRLIESFGIRAKFVPSWCQCCRFVPTQQRFDANAIMPHSLVPFRPEGGCSYHFARDGWQRFTTQRNWTCTVVCRPNGLPLFFMVAQFSSAYNRQAVDLRCYGWGFRSMDPFMSLSASLGTRTLCPS
eukprot:6492723-Amphidinium_carterae.2